MAGSKTGTPSIVRKAREICRLVTRYGAGDLGARTSPEFAEAITLLVTACLFLETLDDYLLEVDYTPPAGPEDQIPA